MSIVLICITLVWNIFISRIDGNTQYNVNSVILLPVLSKLLSSIGRTIIYRTGNNISMFFSIILRSYPILAMVLMLFIFLRFSHMFLTSSTSWTFIQNVPSKIPFLLSICIFCILALSCW